MGYPSCLPENFEKRVRMDGTCRFFDFPTLCGLVGRLLLRVLLEKTRASLVFGGVRGRRVNRIFSAVTIAKNVPVAHFLERQFQMLETVKIIGPLDLLS